MLATSILGGVSSLPMYATLAALYTLFSSDGDDPTEKIRKALPDNNLLRDLVVYGAPSLGGVNMGGSLKMETPFTKALTGRAITPKEFFGESIGSILGIPYNLFVERPSQILEANKHGNISRAVEAIVPTFAANVIQAHRLMVEGQTSMSGRPINVPGRPGARKLTEREAFGKALGFQPTSSTKSYDAYMAQKNAEAARSDKIDDLTVMALKSTDTGNPEGRSRMLRELRAWNDKMKAEGKLHMIIKIQDVQRRVLSRRRENRPTPKQKQKGTAYAQVWGL